MIVKQYIKDFENLEFGMFVHFGLYSTAGRGEWIHMYGEESDSEYMERMNKFDPDPDWAEELAKTAVAAGCKYITITTRHHDGFSLYDASPVSDYDAPHGAAGRDLIREFVDACRKHGLKPFFYHTLLDWHEPTYESDFKKYLKYLRDSVEILCTRYGEIGGIWFDGMWNKRDADWEEDALYGMIRSHQPNAMIINNTGMGAMGQLGHIELDSVTFERGAPKPINMEGSPKYIASEMCQIFGDHWGYAALDFNYKSLADIIKDYCVCRRYGSNFLLNVGPMASGKLRPLDTAMLNALGDWIETFKEACVGTKAAGIELCGSDTDFIMKGNGAYYVFCHDLPMAASPDIAKARMTDHNFNLSFELAEKIKSVEWLVTGGEVEFTQNGTSVTLNTKPQPYGQSVVVRIAKINVE